MSTDALIAAVWAGVLAAAGRSDEATELAPIFA